VLEDCRSIDYYSPACSQESLKDSAQVRLGVWRTIVGSAQTEDFPTIMQLVRRQTLMLTGPDKYELRGSCRYRKGVPQNVRRHSPADVGAIGNALHDTLECSDAHVQGREP
jgi:hypothetical protein